MAGSSPAPDRHLSPAGSSTDNEPTQPGSGEATSEAAPSVAPALTRETVSQAASALLEQEIARLTRHGYMIVDRETTSVQLRRAKRFSLPWALFWLIVVPGGGIFIYLGWYVLVKRDRIVFLRITPDGRVMLSSS